MMKAMHHPVSTAELLWNGSTTPQILKHASTHSNAIAKQKMASMWFILSMLLLFILDMALLRQVVETGLFASGMDSPNAEFEVILNTPRALRLYRSVQTGSIWLWPSVPGSSRVRMRLPKEL